MTNPRLAYENRNGERMYSNPVKKRTDYDSVTSILGTSLPKPWLVPWASRVVAETATWVMEDMDDIYWYGADGWPNESGFLAPYVKPLLDGDDGFYPEVDWDLLTKDLATIPLQIRDTAGDLGDRVHKACEEILITSRGSYKVAAALVERYDQELASHLGAMVTFLEENDVKVLLTEETMFNDEVAYAGSCDLVCTIDDRPWFIDIKTSNSLWASHGLQVCAYAFCKYYVNEKDEEVPLETVYPNLYPGSAKGGLLHLPSSGRACLREVEVSQRMFDVFRTLKYLKVNWNDDISRKALKEKVWTEK